MSASLVANYDSDSQSEEESSSSASKIINESLASADVMLNQPVHGKASSVFANPYLEKESSSRDCLEKHVKLTSTKQMPSDGQQTCWKFLKGRCPYGDSCRYSHGSDNFSAKAINTQLDSASGISNTVEQKKRKRCGLAQGLVPPKKYMQMYNKSKTTH